MIDPKEIEGHTPGPWEIDHVVTTLSGATRALITADGGAVDVATVHPVLEPPHARDSNAALIAAAPALYAFWLANQWQPIETAPNKETILVSYEDLSVEIFNADENDYDWTLYVYAATPGVCSPTHWRPISSALAPGK